MNTEVAQPSKDGDFDLYKILLDELQSMHQEWINNFRVILSFNAILLPACVVLLAFLLKGEVIGPHGLLAYWLLLLLAVVGMVVTVTGLSILHRLQQLRGLRHGEVRRLERILAPRFSILPYWEGYSAIGGDVDGQLRDEFGSAFEQPPRITSSPLHGFWAYVVIATAFLVLYLAILVLSIIEMVV